MKGIKRFLNTELGIFLLLLFGTTSIIIGNNMIFDVLDKNSKKCKIYKSYYVTVKDHVCKCDITYKTDSIRIDSFIHFRSEGIDYQIDTSLIKQIK